MTTTTHPALDLLVRSRRNRKSPAIRALLEETTLRPQDLVTPFFLLPGISRKEPIPTLPGIDRLSLDLLLAEAYKLHAQGIPAIALFPVIAKEDKDPEGSYALRPDGLIPQAVALIKKEIPSLCIIADIALDPFTTHGHDGFIDSTGHVLNDPTVAALAQMALVYAEAGIDIVAPSDMMDGRVLAIRRALDEQGHHGTSILSYAVKYASSLYSPYRDAVGSQLQLGDKKGYQLNPANTREALARALLDEAEGADMLMVKPALFYLDILTKLKEQTHLPLCAYHITGEYAMVMAAQERGMLDAAQVFFEALLSIKRAGANFIFTYATQYILPLIRSGYEMA